MNRKTKASIIIVTTVFIIAFLAYTLSNYDFKVQPKPLFQAAYIQGNLTIIYNGNANIDFIGYTLYYHGKPSTV